MVTQKLTTSIIASLKAFPDLLARTLLLIYSHSMRFIYTHIFLSDYFIGVCLTHWYVRYIRAEILVAFARHCIFSVCTRQSQ